MKFPSFDAKTMAPRSLKELEGVWLELFADMKRSPDRYGIDAKQLAAPFLSCSSLAYTPGTQGTVMLVGKATLGMNTLGSDPVQETYSINAVKSRREAVINEVIIEKEHSPFMRFAESLSNVVLAKSGENFKTFENLIWTNIAKIGVISENPSGRYFAAQMELAVETLAAEIAYYKPSLVVTSTAWFEYGPLRRAIPEMWDDHPDHSDHRAKKQDWWVYPAKGERPAFLWTMHPQAKPKTTLTNWLEKAQRLSRDGALN